MCVSFWSLRYGICFSIALGACEFVAVTQDLERLKDITKNFKTADVPANRRKDNPKNETFFTPAIPNNEDHVRAEWKRTRSNESIGSVDSQSSRTRKRVRLSTKPSTSSGHRSRVPDADWSHCRAPVVKIRHVSPFACVASCLCSALRSVECCTLRLPC